MHALRDTLTPCQQGGQLDHAIAETPNSGAPPSCFQASAEHSQPSLCALGITSSSPGECCNPFAPGHLRRGARMADFRFCPMRSVCCAAQTLQHALGIYLGGSTNLHTLHTAILFSRFEGALAGHSSLSGTTHGLHGASCRVLLLFHAFPELLFPAACSLQGLRF